VRILILEDDVLTGLQMQALLEESGHDVVGPCGTLAKAWGALAPRPDYAFLDIDLPDGKSFGVATALQTARVPFTFVSGSRHAEIPAPLAGAPFIAKPFADAAIQAALLRATEFVPA